jgi:predicted ATP-dependent protease
MLRVAVVEAVAAGKFHIWAVDTVDEGIEILTGRSAGEIHSVVKARLKELAEILEKYRGGGSD